ncbi:MAG: Gfo/Idh/MocA family oxidoreductase [Actinomycetota bacterium]
MNKIKVCIIGAGNISNTRHIPALKKVEEAEIVGVLSNRLERAKSTAEKNQIKNFSTVVDNVDENISELKRLSWFKDVDAVVIGTPPHLHYGLVRASLELGKNVLVEKPMMMNKAECDELIELAEKKKKIFYVMHNFQYASKMLKLNEIISSKCYGEVESITEMQFTNHDRRLPEWYNDLPMGLFYDEAAHFVYLLERHAGSLVINNSFAVYDEENANQTPKTLTINAKAGKVPVIMMLNFHAPVCEWYYIVNFKKRVYIYDFFKDILITLPTDNEHLASDILLNSIRYTWQYWSQFIANGFKMLTGNLLYGHDLVLRSFIRSIQGSEVDENLTAQNGRKNVISINEIIKKANSRVR